MVADGVWGIAIVAVVLLVVLWKSDEIPKIGRRVGRFIGEFKMGKLDAEKEYREAESAFKAGIAPK